MYVCMYVCMVLFSIYYIYIMWYTSGTCCFHPETSTQFNLHHISFQSQGRSIDSLWDIFVVNPFQTIFWDQRIFQTFPSASSFGVGDRVPKQNTETSRGIWSTKGSLNGWNRWHVNSLPTFVDPKSTGNCQWGLLCYHKATLFGGGKQTVHRWYLQDGTLKILYSSNRVSYNPS